MKMTGKGVRQESASQLSASEDESYTEDDDPVETVVSPESSDSDLSLINSEDEDEEDDRPEYSDSSAAAVNAGAAEAADLEQEPEPEPEAAAAAAAVPAAAAAANTRTKTRAVAAPAALEEPAAPEGAGVGAGADSGQPDTQESSLANGGSAMSQNARSSGCSDSVLFCNRIHHPIQLEHELDEKSAKNESRWKLNFTRYLLKAFKWINQGCIQQISKKRSKTQ
jgi:hypothetical protein